MKPDEIADFQNSGGIQNGNDDEHCHVIISCRFPHSDHFPNNRPDEDNDKPRMFGNEGSDICVYCLCIHRFIIS
jgi:hypothetical protein